MSEKGSHFIRVTDLPVPITEEFFPFVHQIENGKSNVFQEGRQSAPVVCLAFLEPSTRTRMSFQIAGQKMGLPVSVFDHSFSSLSKGETLADTLGNLDRLQPDLMVVRCPESLNLAGFSEQPLHSTLINGGWGAQEHPTQALLDAYTLWKHFGDLQGVRVLIMGDVRHSRVAASFAELVSQLGSQVGCFCPAGFEPQPSGLFQVFENKEEALLWAQACMLLRVQKERGAEITKDYLNRFGLDERGLKTLSKEALILHPGPVNRGVEISEAAYKDPRSKILEQVTNGLYVRMALFDVLLKQRVRQ